MPPDVTESANRLDLFHMGSRYPDALAEADALKVLQVDDAKAAGARAGRVCDFAAGLIERAQRESGNPPPS